MLNAKKLLMLTLLPYNILFAQAPGSNKQTIILQADAPQAVSTVSAQTQPAGVFGSRQFFYWVVATYPIGKSTPFGPAQVTMVADTLTGTNKVVVNWSPVTNATSYDVLRTTTPFLPQGTANILLATVSSPTTTYSNVNETISSYTVSNAQAAQATMGLDNTNYPLPVLTFSSFPIVPSYTGSGNPTQNCVIGQEYFQTGATPGSNIWLCTNTNIWTQLTGGGGGGAAGGGIYSANGNIGDISVAYTHNANTNNVIVQCRDATGLPVIGRVDNFTSANTTTIYFDIALSSAIVCKFDTGAGTGSNIADKTISGNISGASASPVGLSLIQVNTLLGSAINAKSYGALGNNSANDRIALLNAITAASGKILYIPSGTYLTDQKLPLTDNMVVQCEPGTIIKATASMDYVLGMPSASYLIQNFGVQNCIADGNSLATNAFYFKNISYTGGILNIWGKNATADGIVFEDSQGGSAYSLHASANAGAGVLFKGSNAFKVFAINSVDNTGDGVLLQNTVNGSGGMQFYGVRSEANGGHGIYQSTATGPSMYDGGWIEGNTGDGVRIASGSAKVTGIRISGVGSGTNYGINIIGALSGLDIRGNYISQSSGSATYAAVKTAGAVVSSVLSPNYSITGAILSSSLDSTTNEPLGVYSGSVVISSSYPLNAGGNVQIGGLGTGSGASRDLVINTTGNHVYVGRISDTSGDNSLFQVRNRVGTDVFKADPNGNGTVTITGDLNVSRNITLGTNNANTVLLNGVAQIGGTDTAFSRIAANVAGLGSGAQGSVAGSLQLTHLIGKGVAPTITAGGGTSPSIAGSDTAFRVTIGTGGVATSVTVTFGTAFTTAPACMANDETTSLLTKAVGATTTVTMSAATPWVAGDTITGVCVGY